MSGWKYAKSIPKVCQTYAKHVLNVCQNYAKSMPNACQTYAKSVPKPSQNHFKLVSKSCQTQTNRTQILDQDHAFICMIQALIFSFIDSFIHSFFHSFIHSQTSWRADLFDCHTPLTLGLLWVLPELFGERSPCASLPSSTRALRRAVARCHLTLFDICSPKRFVNEWMEVC